MKSSNRNYCKGQIVIIFALSLIVLVGMVGLAIDSGLAYGVKAKLSAAVDAAAIAGARALSTGASDDDRKVNAKAAAQKFFAGNFPSNYLGVDPTKTTISTNAEHLSNGYWQVTVTAKAVMPTTFIRVLSLNQVTIAALGETIRRDLDMILVLDTTGSLGPPWTVPSAFPAVQAAAISFISKFAEGPGGDRVGLVTFAMGAEVDEHIKTDSTRGFSKASVTTKIKALTNEGGTASAAGMRKGFNELNAVPAALRSSLRVIVFFSDGAPNGVPATFTRDGGTPTNPNDDTPVTADIYAGPFGVDTGNQVFWGKRAGADSNGDVYLGDWRNKFYTPKTISDIPSLPPTSGATLTLTGIGSIQLASYNNIRTLVGNPYTNTRCNANKAARNMLENIANTSRGQNIVVFSIGLGDMLNQLEVIGCNYDPPNTSLPPGTCPAHTDCPECGCSIMKRVANTTDSNTYNADQPVGRFIYAADASELDSAFSAIANEILRLSK